MCKSFRASIYTNLNNSKTFGCEIKILLMYLHKRTKIYI